MKFTKEFLQELVWDEGDDNVEVIEDELIDESRWSLHYRMIFKYDEKYYETFYSKGATEQQDESPYEFEDDEIECVEVFPIEKVITVYERSEK
jgi:hypothetical protein